MLLLPVQTRFDVQDNFIAITSMFHGVATFQCNSLTSSTMLAGQLDRDPYWARLWSSALVTARELLQNPDLVKGKRVCDLGAGLGMG